MALNLPKLKDKARKHELKDQTDKAIRVYEDIISQLKGSPEMDSELPLYNKLGDLYLKKNDGNRAVEMYEKAAKRYNETGFPNSSIALYNKILRSAPGRTVAYLELGKLMVERGFAAEAKKHFREYIERMDKGGKLDYALDCLKSFADSSTNTEDTRITVAELLKEAAHTDEARDQLAKLYAEAEAEGDEAKLRRTMDKMLAIDPDFDPEDQAVAAAKPKKKGRTSDIVFLNFDTEEYEVPEVEAPTAQLEDLETTAAVVDETALETADTDGLEIEDTAVEGAEQVLEGAAAEAEAAVEREVLELEGAPEPALEPVASTDRGLALDAGLDLKPPADPDLGLQVPEAPTGPSVEELEQRVSQSPDDPDRRRELAEALIESGDSDRGFAELDQAMQGYEVNKDWDHARACADQMLRLNPNDITHHQKKVEFISHLGDKPRLVTAYLALADALVREGDMDQARSAYLSVLEHDPVNAEATTALETVVPASQKPVEVAGETAEGFVDLGELILGEEQDQVKDTRMKTRESLVRSGNEQADFGAVLSQFKQGIEESIAEDDSEAHYDLGVAFKEMGLVDEAIAEFQKALRGSQARLKAAEALGGCFYEKGQLSVAQTVLRRGVESDEAGDDTKIAMLYLIGRCEEEQGNLESALSYYRRVLVVDIQFEDVGDRVAKLGK